jgi:hypothetical protein
LLLILSGIGGIRLPIREKPNCFWDNDYSNIAVILNLATPILVLCRTESKQMENEVSYSLPVASLLPRLKADVTKSGEKEDLCQGELKN